MAFLRCCILHLPNLGHSLNKNQNEYIRLRSNIIQIAKKNNFGLSLELDYTKTIEGEKRKINYKIQSETLSSNLGKGEIYYFVCPFSFKRCKVLYMGYGSLYFKSRKAYRHRIYYASKLSSYLDKHNDKYWSLERRLEKLYIKHPKTHSLLPKSLKRLLSSEVKFYYY